MRGRTFAIRKGNLWEVVDPQGRVVASGGLVHRPGQPHPALGVEVADGYTVREPEVGAPIRVEITPGPARGGSLVAGRDLSGTFVDRRPGRGS